MPVGETLASRRIQSKNISALKCPGDASTYCSLAWSGWPDKTPLESWATRIPDVAPALYPQIMTEERS